MTVARVLDAAAVRRWLILAEQALGTASASIDMLNVFPVPDADTGTNLHRTVACAARAAAALPETASAGQLWNAATAASLTGACGNSGIIFSQLLRGLADVCADAAPCDGEALASALRHAAVLARSAVRRPVEGTVLTVADAAAAAAHGAGLAEVASAAIARGRQAPRRARGPRRRRPPGPGRPSGGPGGSSRCWPRTASSTLAGRACAWCSTRSARPSPARER